MKRGQIKTYTVAGQAVTARDLMAVTGLTLKTAHSRLNYYAKGLIDKDELYQPVRPKTKPQEHRGIHVTSRMDKLRGYMKPREDTPAYLIATLFKREPV